MRNTDWNLCEWWRFFKDLWSCDQFQSFKNVSTRRTYCTKQYSFTKNHTVNDKKHVTFKVYYLFKQHGSTPHTSSLGWASPAAGSGAVTFQVDRSWSLCFSLWARDKKCLFGKAKRSKRKESFCLLALASGAGDLWPLRLTGETKDPWGISLAQQPEMPTYNMWKTSKINCVVHFAKS